MQELANAILQGRGQTKQNKKQLTWCQWEMAFSRFALAADMAGMQPYASSMAHMVLSSRMTLHDSTNCV